MYRGEDQEEAPDLTIRVLPTAAPAENDFLLIDLTRCGSAEELSTVSRYARSLLSGNNFVHFDQRDSRITDEKKQKLFVAHNGTEMAWLASHLNRCSGIIYCCDSPASLGSVVFGELVCAVAREASGTGAKPKPLVIDFLRDTLDFKSLKLLGFLDCKLLHKLAGCSGTIDVTIPNSTRVNLHHRLFDTLISGILNYQKGNVAGSLERLLNGFRFHLPNVAAVEFWEPASDGCQRTNSINVKAKRLKRLRLAGFGLESLFRVHSLAGWDMPRLETFSGHELRFGNSEFFNRECALARGDRGELDIELFPRGVRSTRMINWNGMLGKFSSESLESLVLTPFVSQESSAISGLWLPNLKCLKFGNDKQRGLDAINFSRSNGLSSCERLEVALHGEPRYVFDMRNLAETFPKVNLHDSFPTHDKDEYIVV